MTWTAIILYLERFLKKYSYLYHYHYSYRPWCERPLIIFLMCKKAKPVTWRSTSGTFAYSVFDSQFIQGSLTNTLCQHARFSGSETMTLAFNIVPRSTKNYTWPLVIFSLVIQPGTLLKAILKFM